MPFLKCNATKLPRSRVLEASAHIKGLRKSIFSVPHDKYIGEWNSSLKEGKGQYLSRSGKFYEGDWVKNFRHGFGVSGFLNADNIISLEYRGEWKHGRKSGLGELHYMDGGFYRGNFKNNVRFGYGQMWYADGAFYDGDWAHDKRHGEGMHIYADSNRYEGNWRNDFKHGKGRYFHLDSGQIQEGVWDDDNVVCSMVMDIPFRQTSNLPTPYIIQRNELVDMNEVYLKRVTNVIMQQRPSCISCASSTESNIKEYLQLYVSYYSMQPFYVKKIASFSMKMAAFCDNFNENIAQTIVEIVEKIEYN